MTSADAVAKERAYQASRRTALDEEIDRVGLFNVQACAPWQCWSCAGVRMRLGPIAICGACIEKIARSRQARMPMTFANEVLEPRSSENAYRLVHA